ncbi:MAG: hypothetical protein SF028_15125 [Candidatus Sumerlaeia bacterium]|nr:hypothetical protein [Candidatus Sumerlaeia bacterium]
MSQQSFNGRKVVLVSAAVTAVLAVVTYMIPYYVVVGAHGKRPAMLEAHLAAAEAALLAYHADHGAFPPQEALWHHWRSRANAKKSNLYWPDPEGEAEVLDPREGEPFRAVPMPTYRLASLTTPVAYLAWPNPGDPYAMPEQFSPTAYLVLDTITAVLWSPGPDTKFGLPPQAARELIDSQGAAAALAAMSYDPTNGAKSAGDLFRLLEANP